jgi:hypothetical protein
LGLAGCCSLCFCSGGYHRGLLIFHGLIKYLLQSVEEAYLG